MWYTLPYANTFICTPAHGGRAGPLGDRAPVRVRLYRPPLPDPPRQCRGPVDHHDGARPAVHRSNRPQCHAGVSPTRPRRAAAPLSATAHQRDPLRCGGLRVSAGPVAPESADVRPAHKPVDARAGCHGQLRPGPDAAPGQRRHHSAGPAPLARDLEAGQTLDHPSRSRLGAKKKTARPADPAGAGPTDVGLGVWRRSWVESAGPTCATWLDGGRSQAPVTRADSPDRRSRSPGARL
jgi:hypothetical protein